MGYKGTMFLDGNRTTIICHYSGEFPYYIGLSYDQLKDDGFKKIQFPIQWVNDHDEIIGASCLAHW